MFRPFSRALLTATLLAGVALGVALTLGAQGMVGPAVARLDPQQGHAVGHRTAPGGSYRANVTAVIDGDTVEARIHVWMGQEVVTRVRLSGIDAPELTGACADSRPAVAARDRLASMIAAGPVLLTDVRPDKYFGRVVGRLLLADGSDAGARLMAEGLARPYGGGRRDSRCAAR